jgi:MoxR-like ATPase
LKPITAKEPDLPFPFYTETKSERDVVNPAELPVAKRVEQTLPQGYIPDPGLVDAVNVALLLGQPLLVTGEPGTGKTQLAYSVGWQLGLGTPLVFETKSTSVAKDLFYTYDSLGRFHAAQTGEGSRDSLDYLTYNALGAAIVRANDEQEVARWLPKEFVHGGKRRSVVLMDEVDKAPRDFPNDILNEIEEVYFKVPELGGVKISAEEAMRPIVILTSNSEKHLPDAFLRRCIYYNIPFPDEKRLRQIVNTRISQLRDDDNPLLSDALELFSILRESNSGLQKSPATAELLGWLIYLGRRGAETSIPLRRQRELILSSASILVKLAEDQKAAERIIKDWLG